jgi:hypothetical protein
VLNLNLAVEMPGVNVMIIILSKSLALKANDLVQIGPGGKLWLKG